MKVASTSDLLLRYLIQAPHYGVPCLHKNVENENRMLHVREQPYNGKDVQK